MTDEEKSLLLRRLLEFDKSWDRHIESKMGRGTHWVIYLMKMDCRTGTELDSKETYCLDLQRIEKSGKSWSDMVHERSLCNHHRLYRH